MNNYITTLSLINDNRPFNPISYKSDLGTFTGCLSNEAPLKYEITRLAKMDETFDNILIFASKEVLEKPIQNVSGQTTIEYFKSFLTRYFDEIRDSFSIIDTTLSSYSSTSDFVEKTVHVLETSNNPNGKDEWGKIIDFLQLYFDPSAKNHFYMDYTGGSRVTSLMVTLLPHLLEMYGAEIKQIIYADINKGQSIVDLTSYYSIIREYENAAKGSTNLQKITSFKNLGGSVSDDTVSDVQELDSIKENESINLSKNVDEKSQKIIKEKKNSNAKLSNIEQAILNNTVQNVETVSKSTPYEKLLRQKDSELIKNFRESIIDILIDQTILVPIKKTSIKNFKQNVKSQLEACDSYYERFDKNNVLISGVIFQLQKLFKSLLDNDQDPLQAFKEMFDLTKMHLINPSYAIGASSYHTKSFLDYIDENEVMLEDESSMSYLDWYEQYHKLMNLYLSFGFPFACTGKSFTYKYIEEHYKKEVDKLLKNVSTLRNTNPSKYRETIIEYTSIEKLEELIPEKVNFNFWKTNKVNPNFEKNLIHQIQEVRPFRNAISHNLQRDLEQEKIIAAKIREWIIEYQKI